LGAETSGKSFSNHVIPDSHVPVVDPPSPTQSFGKSKDFTAKINEIDEKIRKFDLFAEAGKSILPYVTTPCPSKVDHTKQGPSPDSLKPTKPCPLKDITNLSPPNPKLKPANTHKWCRINRSIRATNDGVALEPLGKHTFPRPLDENMPSKRKSMDGCPQYEFLHSTVEAGS